MTSELYAWKVATLLTVSPQSFSLVQLVIGGFLGDDHIVRVAFDEPGGALTSLQPHQAGDQQLACHLQYRSVEEFTFQPLWEGHPPI